MLFARLVEAFEVTAAQRGVPRWEDPVCTKRHRTLGTSALVASQSYQTQSRPNPPSDYSALALLEFSDVQKDAFRSFLPLVASLAAGFPFHGFETASMDDLSALPWIAVPAHLAKPNSYAVRVAGHSMSPTLEDGDIVVFEYHRSPRGDRQIVVANIPEFPDSAHGTEAVKRLSQDSTHWIFESDNPQYQPFSVLKSDAPYPILGTFVARMG